MLLLTACIENELEDKDAVEPAFDSGDGDWGETADSEAEAELCNGADDDGDGEIDEGFPDDDGNGRVDCLDETCPALELAVAGPVTAREDCDTGLAEAPVAEPWAATLLWELRASPIEGWIEGRHLPAVGDLDGDGLPEVAVLAAGSSEAELVVLDGASGDLRWSRSGFGGYSGVAILDLDQDGEGELVARAASGELLAFEADGSELWTSADSPSFYANTSFVAADVDGDGVAELLAEDLVLDAATGATRLRLPTRAGTYYRQAAVADLDLDGVVEIYFDGMAYDPDGSARWSAEASAGTASWALPVQADADPEGEVVLAGSDWELYEADGSLLSAVPFTSAAHRPGVPCAADFDGDGQTEVAHTDYDHLDLRELDGSVVWTVVVDDSTGLAGCSASDLDGDGDHELLYADQDRAWVFDGATGAVLLDLGARPSMTTFEYPIPADLDGDGSAEILLIESGEDATQLIRAWRHDGEGWRAYTSTWGVHDRSPGRQAEDGSIPADSVDAWEEGLLRATEAAPLGSGQDLVPRLTDLCIADCTYGPVALAFAVENQGLVDVAAGVEAVVYADDGGSHRELARVSLPELPAATTSDGFEVELAVEELGSVAIGVVVDVGGAVGECDETNNEAWTYEVC